MPYYPIHQRHSIRLQGYDYSQEGAYFVTICTLNRRSVLGEVANGTVQLSWQGQSAAISWEWLARQYSYVDLDMWVIMPNHLHGILVISDVDNSQPGASRCAPTTRRKSLGSLIGAFKTISTKAINEFHHSPGEVFWQRNYYEHIVRNEVDLNRIREYILLNPARWERDEYYSTP